ncbi:MAG: hypothetical protein EU535_07285 [Promethearchaeota archaeon]|nr:MAG: hypothetical protein EU535_07285 [Candidatus Lokiarchaeota archaeon]
MKSYKKYLFFWIFIVILIGINFEIQYNDILSNDPQRKALDDEFSTYKDRNPSLSTTNNYDNIEAIFNEKLNDYNSHGYFPHIYEPSLQATYMALYILDTLGRLDQIDQTRIINYIMSHYNASAHIFMDKYAYRYLDTDIDLAYFPWNSILEVNCYAILSLDLLGRLDLDLIDIQESIDFIWSCYNPVTSGFIGQPYDVNLAEFFKISLMDITYYAVTTLDLLMNHDWTSNLQERNDLIAYINGLQITTSSREYEVGGFTNNEYTDFNHFDDMFGPIGDPNLFSAYYCLKTLEIFGSNALDTINIENFKSYLSYLYQTGNYFIIAYWATYNPMDLAATGIGVELSELIGYININRSEAINFILDNRNTDGGWSNTVHYNSLYDRSTHELIDTFQVIRSLKNLGEIPRLTEAIRNKIASYLGTFYQNKGYSLISNDYIFLNHINSIVNSFNLYGRTFELDILEIYDSLLDALYTEGPFGEFNDFRAYTHNDGRVWGFRSCPIEYCNMGFHNHITNLDVGTGHKANFMALDSMLKILKLDDFALELNLNQIIQSVINSQFLDEGYDNFGLFYSSEFYSWHTIPSWFRDKNIYFEYSFYSIKILELLSNYLGLGPITDLAFNKGALYNNILNNTVETSTSIHFDPGYTNDIEIILENTYYMVYILKALNLYALNNQKIKNYLLQNIDYSNIKNIYYIYKISEILNLDFSFDLTMTQNLVQEIYSEDLNEFFLTTNKQTIAHEAFLWVCDMAKNDELKFNCNYRESLLLGDLNTITVSFQNIICDDFGPNIDVRLESTQLGTLTLDKQVGNLYQVSFMVPVDPIYFPLVEGIIKVYNGLSVIGEVPISIQTIYELNSTYIIQETREIINFEVNMSYMSFLGPTPTCDSNISAEVLKNNTFSDTLNFYRQDFAEFSTYTLDYEFVEENVYDFNIIMIDEYHPSGLQLFTSTVNTSQVPKDPPSEPDPVPDPNLDPTPDPDPDPDPSPDEPWLGYMVIGLLVGVIVSIGGVIGIWIFFKWIKKKWNKWRKKGRSPKDYGILIQNKISIDKGIHDIEEIAETLFDD